MNKEYYLCYYSVGEYDDYREVNVFITNDLKKSKLWVRKFNNLIKKWKSHYSQYEEIKCGFPWIKDEYTEQYYDRWSSLRDINNANYNIIEFR